MDGNRDDSLPLDNSDIPDEVDDGLAFAYGGGLAFAYGGETGDTIGEKVNDVIDRYTLIEEIGEGGMGTVWMAQQSEPLKRKVALKIIKLGMDTKEVIIRFEGERQALALMDHPHIAKVLDGGATTNGRPFFVMELVNGIPITEYCDKAKLGLRDRLELFGKVCEAIQHAHHKGIIHRDIKPSNVMVTFNDGVPVPKVIDFGIAKATSAELTQKTLFTQHAQIIGTPEYMAPEQAEMSGLDIDTRADVYSLGVLLYELLTGTKPFDMRKLLEAGYDEFLRTIREVDPVKPSTRISTLGDSATPLALNRHVNVESLSKRLRGDLDWIVMRALEKDRSRRYETPHGFAADIARYLNNETVEAHPPSGIYRLRKFVHRRKKTVIAVATILFLLVGGSIGTGVGWWKTTQANRSLDIALDQINDALKQEEQQRKLAEANEQRATAAEADAKSKAERASKAEAVAQNNERLAVEQTEVAQRELARAVEIKNLITEMLKGVTPEQAKGADLTLLKGILDTSSKRLEEGAIEDALVAAELHALIGDVYHSLGFYSEAERHLPVVGELRTRVLGEKHPHTLASRSNLARLYLTQGRFAEAEPLFLRTLEIMKSVLGEEHLHTLETRTNLATLYRFQSRYAEAEPLNLRILEIQKRVTGEEHPDTLTSMNNLAALYKEQGRDDEAELLYLRTLEIQKRVLSEEHPDTLKSMSNLATLYIKQARHTEAESLFLKTIEIMKRVLGEEHPDTLASMNNLANLYEDQARHTEAERLYLRTLEIQRRVLGEEHRDTLGSMNNVAGLYYRKGRYAEAEPLYLRTLEIRERLLGVEHRDTLASMNNLALLYSTQDRYAEAESLFLEALETWERLLGEEHPDALGTMNNLAKLYVLQDRNAEAEPLYLRTLEIQKRVLGEEHPGTMDSMGGLANVYLAQGRYAEALPLSLKALEIRKRLLGEEHLYTLGATTNLGFLYLSMELFEDAASMFEVSLSMKRRVLGLQHPWTGYAMEGLVTAYVEMDRFEDALPLQRERVGLLVAAANKSNATTIALIRAAEALLAEDFDETLDPEQALAFAGRACAFAEADGSGASWGDLSVLASAQHLTGDDKAAVETQRRVLARMPDGVDPKKREDQVEKLADYEAAAADR